MQSKYICTLYYHVCLMFMTLVVMMGESSTIQEEKRRCGHFVAMDSDSQLLNFRTDDETTHPLDAEQLEETSFDTGQYCLLHRMLVEYVSAYVMA